MSTDRLRQISDAVRDGGRRSVAELAELTGASEMTIRRDLEVLAGQGVLERYRGGARSLLLPGGRPRPGELGLTGPLTEASLAALRFDTAVIGCCGLTAYDLADAAIKRAAIASARRVIVVAEAAKLSRTALAFVAPASALDAVVTERSAPVDETDALTDAGVTVRTV